ncbi:Hpt domain-containing protein [Desulfurivibrio alkaliphilus]|uniref:Hpt domain protein n=1 Tax=Desulfurivibrio alkaliphilus (strain DSM 19089 / UNIQEM U267 / AHT2) TaxID=589865 RepID=D6Z1B4_DESAT|nr:Hpt domain-containing protein [Desulfurivibrio alkaliphilus]ADH85369.1 Hpt domain protein [Desulfurivibrio alkaliphilus AHT 2]
MADKLAEHIREALPQSLAQLRQAIDDNNPREMSRQAHALKSPLATFGALGAFRLAREMELRGEAGDMSRSLALLVTLEGETQRIIDFFNDPDWRDQV